MLTIQKHLLKANSRILYGLKFTNFMVIPMKYFVWQIVQMESLLPQLAW